MSVGLRDWRPFLRALAEEIDAVAGPTGRDALLRRTGLRMAALCPLPASTSTEALAIEMNEVLSGAGWGSVAIEFSEAERCLYLTHRGMPRIGGGGTPPGTWLGSVLEGLYEGWLGQQPGADTTLNTRRATSDSGETVVLRYGRS
jgi:hypothetical protein